MACSFKILYNCAPHGVLEYDELRLLFQAGHEVYSLGDYWNREAPISGVRELNPSFYNDSLTKSYLADRGCDRATRSVSPEFCRKFDVIFASGVEVWMHENFPSFGTMPVILRTIGQSNLMSENLLAQYGDRITIVRYSPMEVGLPGFAKTDAVIYFGKNVSDFPIWEGGDPPVTFHSHYKARDAISAPHFSEYKELASGFDARLYGLNDPDGGHIKGHLDYREQLQALATAGCYIYVWSQPPSYTLSLIEAMMVGVPVVAPSAMFISHAPPDPLYGWLPSRYEVSTMLSDGCGLIYDTVEQGREQIRTVVRDRGFAKEISTKSRIRARALFDSQLIAEQWNILLKNLCCKPGGKTLTEA